MRKSTQLRSVIPLKLQRWTERGGTRASLPEGAASSSSIFQEEQPKLWGAWTHAAQGQISAGIKQPQPKARHYCWNCSCGACVCVCLCWPLNMACPLASSCLALMMCSVCVKPLSHGNASCLLDNQRRLSTPRTKTWTEDQRMVDMFCHWLTC